MDINVNHIRHKLLFDTFLRVWRGSLNDQTHICACTCARTHYTSARSPSLYSQTLSCVHTHPHQTQTASIMNHFDVWRVGLVDVWWKPLVCLFLICFFVFFLDIFQAWTDPADPLGRTEEQRGTCVWGQFVLCFKMRDIFVCACTTDLSHESNFSRLLLLLFVVRQCARLTCSPRRVWQNAWCCTSLQTASTRPPGGLPADCWIEKASRVELSSQAGRGSQSREKQSGERQKMTTSVIRFIRRGYRACVFTFIQLLFSCQIRQEREDLCLLFGLNGEFYLPVKRQTSWLWPGDVFW